MAASHLQAWQELPGNPFLPACPILLFRARAEGQSTERAHTEHGKSTHRAWKEHTQSMERGFIQEACGTPSAPLPFPCCPSQLSPLTPLQATHPNLLSHSSCCGCRDLPPAPPQMQDPLPGHGTCPSQAPPSHCEHPPMCLPHSPCSPLGLCLQPLPPLPFPRRSCTAPWRHRSRDIPIPALLPVRRLLLLGLRLLLPPPGLGTEHGDVSNEA